MPRARESYRAANPQGRASIDAVAGVSSGMGAGGGLGSGAGGLSA